MAYPDREEQLAAQANVTGIDFIDVDDTQVLIDIHFFKLQGVQIGQGILNHLVANDIRIYDPSGNLPDVLVTAISWPQDFILQLQLSNAGDFTPYKILIDDRQNNALPYSIDPFFNDVEFSFKVNCPSDLDCKTPEHECENDPPLDFTIDYQARDFWSYRKALLDFASLRYPDWPDRLEADAGVMLAEVMSALGDEMAYYQDRIAREAHLETATQRKSARRHALLVDYNIRESMGSSTWILFVVQGNGNIPAGYNMWAQSDNGTRFEFEVGNGLEDSLNNTSFPVRIARNQYTAFIYDDDELCLPFGSTQLWVNGHHKVDIEGDPGFNTNGKWMLLGTRPTRVDQPVRRHMVRVTSCEEITEPIQNLPITLLKWGEEHSTPFEMDRTCLFVAANVLPATSGRTLPLPGQNELFIVGRDDSKLSQLQVTRLNQLQVPSALARQGSNDCIKYLYTLPSSALNSLTWFQKGDDVEPEVFLESVNLNPPNGPITPIDPWQWVASFLDGTASDPGSHHYTLDDGTWRNIVRYGRNPADITHADYASDQGLTIRFGDGEFGMTPPPNTVFRVKYRLGGGANSNVPGQSINWFNAGALGFAVTSITNPFPAVNGVDAETIDQVRQAAPQDFRERTFRAVRPEDYAEAAQRLDWVQRAGASFRWTGSWLSAFVTPDPRNTVSVAPGQRRSLIQQLDRFRQAGREVIVLDPRYADLDIEIEICTAPDSYGGEVKERVITKLLGKKGINSVAGFFSADKFTFGEPLQRSVLEACVQEIPGVLAVEEIRFRRTGYFDMRMFDEYAYDPGKNAIIRVENDLLHPDRGSLKIYMHGGR